MRIVVMLLLLASTASAQEPVIVLTNPQGKTEINRTPEGVTVYQRTYQKHVNPNKIGVWIDNPYVSQPVVHPVRKPVENPQLRNHRDLQNKSSNSSHPSILWLWWLFGLFT